jgi:NADPH-dependent 2,4-dienoyl-CoA reductase/sulfur reductase-like enzyme/rhodanese-related sulfurtransferase
MNPRRRIVVVGGGAAGRAAAFRARRQDAGADILVIDRRRANPDLDARSVRERHAIEVRAGSEVVALDARARRVRVVDPVGATCDEPFDALVWASGTRPIGLEGLPEDGPGLGPSAAGRRVAVVGAGFAALETIARAESLVPKDVCWIVPPGGLVSELDLEIAHLLERHLTARGVRIDRCGARVRAERNAPSDSWRIRDDAGGEWPADVAVAAMGATPNVSVAAAAGVKLGATGAIAVGRRMETNLPEIFAAGACAEAPNAILVYEATWTPSVGAAIRSGHVAGSNAAGATNDTFDGVVGCRSVRVSGLEVGALGLSERAALERHYDVVVAHAHPRWRGGTASAIEFLVVKVVLDKMSGWTLGVQAVGSSVGPVLDVFAAAIVGGTPIDKIAQFDFASAPSGDARPPVAVAARVAENAQRGFVDTVSAPALRAELENPDVDARPVLIDVRDAASGGAVPGSVAIPFAELDGRSGELSSERPIVVISETGRTAYAAARLLGCRGFAVRILSGGLECWPFDRTET